MTYKNPFYSKGSHDSKSEYSTYKWTDYKGYRIVERIQGTLFDVILGNEIVTMRAGLNGAKQYIDEQAGVQKEILLQS